MDVVVNLMVLPEVRVGRGLALAEFLVLQAGLILGRLGDVEVLLDGAHLQLGERPTPDFGVVRVAEDGLDVDETDPAAAIQLVLPPEEYARLEEVVLTNEDLNTVLEGLSLALTGGSKN